MQGGLMRRKNLRRPAMTATGDSSFGHWERVSVMYYCVVCRHLMTLKNYLSSPVGAKFFFCLLGLAISWRRRRRRRGGSACYLDFPLLLSLPVEPVTWDRKVMPTGLKKNSHHDGWVWETECDNLYFLGGRGKTSFREKINQQFPDVKKCTLMQVTRYL